MDILHEGQYVRLVGMSVPAALVPAFWRAKTGEPFQYETGNTSTAEFTSVASGADSGFMNISVLEPDNNPRHLFRVRWGIKDGCQYQIKIPTGSDRLGLDDDYDVARIDNVKSPYYAPSDLYEFWLISDMYPAINAMNRTGVAVTPKVFFEGTKYDLESIDDSAVIQKLRNFDLGVTPFIPSKRITLGGLQR